MGKLGGNVQHYRSSFKVIIMTDCFAVQKTKIDRLLHSDTGGTASLVGFNFFVKMTFNFSVASVDSVLCLEREAIMAFWSSLLG